MKYIISVFIILMNYKSIRKIRDNIKWFIKKWYNTTKVDKNLLMNKEWIEHMNISINSFNWNKRKMWLSWFARLKNADHYLYKCIKTHIDYYDEIVLIDNQSTDKTKEICKKLKREFPNKIKFYEYDYEVYFWWSEQHKQTPSNSIHSLSYYYNWSLSKTSYKYISKIDDDNFMIWEKLWKIRSKILTDQSKNSYYYYSWINTIKENNIYKILDDLDIKYIWLYWDHWFFPVNEYTYFIQNNNCEEFKCNLKYNWQWFIFIHLKFLKPNNWVMHVKIIEKSYKMMDKIKKSKKSNSIFINNNLKNV